MIHEKKPVFQLASLAQCFSSRQPWILVHRSASCVFPFCDTLILTLNRCVPKGWFNKIDNSYFLIKEVKWKWLFSPLWGQSVPLPWLLRRHQQVYPAVAFAPSVQTSTQWERQMLFHYYYENSFSPCNPPEKAPGLWTPLCEPLVCGLSSVLQSWKGFWWPSDTHLQSEEHSLQALVIWRLLKIHRPLTKLPESKPLWKGLRNLSSKVA